jgi:hypothetical protein
LTNSIVYCRVFVEMHLAKGDLAMTSIEESETFDPKTEDALFERITKQYTGFSIAELIGKKFKFFSPKLIIAGTITGLSIDTQENEKDLSLLCFITPWYTDDWRTTKILSVICAKEGSWYVSTDHEDDNENTHWGTLIFLP